MKTRLYTVLSWLLPVLVLGAVGTLLFLRPPREPGEVVLTDDPLRITELMVYSSAAVTGADGAPCQWVELYNTGDAPVALEDYSLGCEEARSPLPAGSLAPGEYALTLSEDWDFLLPEKGTVKLYRGTGLADSVVYSNKAADCSYLVSLQGECGQPTPGYGQVRPGDALVISEVMSSNDHWPIGGMLCDWVELYNTGDAPVELGEYYLSKRADKPYACRLPEQTLESGEYAVLRCGVELSFNVSRDGAELYLTRSDGVGAGALSLPALGSDESYTYDGALTLSPSPGYPNTPEGALLALRDRGAGLVISEVMTSNSSAYAASGGYYDWVELYNGSGTDVELGGLFLSKSKKDLQRWQLPAGVLKSGEYCVILCSGNGGAECSFRLDAEGDDLYLSTLEGAVLDALALPAVPTDRSWGRSGDELVYFAAPTPGAANGGGYPRLSNPPVPSVPSGMYDETFSVTLSGEGKIYYTLDGSLPSTRSKRYTGDPIPINGTSSIRTFCVEGDHIPSGIYTYNYFINIPDYELDVLKVTVANYKFINDLSFETNTGKFPANIALYVDGEEQFSAGCEISLFGSGSRAFDKKSYQIDFKADYGPGKLRYKLFDSLELEEFDSLILRSGAQDIFYATLRDEFFTSLLGEACENLLVQAYRPVNLYVNGDYRGIYYIRERVTDDMISAHCGVSPDTVTIVRGYSYVARGPDAADWLALREYILRSDLSVEANYRYVTEHLDIASTIDFFLATMWSTNYDNGNIKLYHSSEGDGKWRFVLYDLDVAMLMDHGGTVQRMCREYGGFLSKLLANPEFLEQCTRRLGELLRGPLAEDAVLARLEDFVALIDGDMRCNCARWPYNQTYEGWLEQVELLRSGRDIGIRGWNAVLIQQYIDAVRPGEELVRRYLSPG